MLREEAVQFRILTRHFFHRFFQNDVVDFEDQMKERLIGVLAILAIFSSLLAYGFLGKYQYIPDTGNSWVEKSAFITFIMLIMGLIAVLEWDVMFPDSRDIANLSPLPVRTRTILMAKFSSLCLLVGLFALSLNTLSSPFFVLLLPKWRSSSPLFIGRYALVHTITMFLACFFAFFIVVLLMGALMTLLGSRLFRRVSPYIRSFVLVVHVFLIFNFLSILYLGPEKLLPLKSMEARVTLLHYLYEYFPPLWFTDLYETLLGNTRLPFHGSVNTAWAGLLVMVAVFYLTTGLSYRRCLSALASVERKKVYLRKIRAVFSDAFNLIFLRNPVQRVVFNFYKKTIQESMTHKMHLATFVGLGLGLIPFQIAIGRVLSKDFLGINKNMLSIPLILSFFLLLGLRGIVNIPVSLESNWVFQLTESKDRRHYFSGLRKGIFLLNILPLFAFLFGFYALVWGVVTAAWHCLFGLALAVLLMEVVFLKNFKIPFTCSYLPGKEKIQLYWVIYLLGFITYINLMTWIEAGLLRTPSGFPMFFGIVLTAVLGIRLYQVFFLYRKNRIQYVEEPEPVVIGLDYKTPLHKKEAR